MRENWIESTIDKFIGVDGVFCDGDWVESKDQNPNGEVRLIQLADIGDGSFRNKSNRYLTKQKSIELKCTYLKKGDILVARMPDPLGRACLFPLENNQQFVTVVDICIIRLKNSKILNSYILYCINSPLIRTKIEQLFSELDNGIANLKKAQEQLKVYRQAVLKKAFEGELTKEWREKQTDLPSADELLEQIKTEREAYYKKQLDEWQQKVKKWEADGKKGQKPSKPKKVKIIKKEIDIIKERLFILPKQWEWITWEETLAFGTESFKRGPFGSSLKKSFFVSKGYKVYEQYCPINDDCSYERYYITQEKYEEMKSFAVQENDFLISCSGVSLGRITQIPKDFKKGIINQALLRLRINSKVYNYNFFKTLFRSPYFQDKIFENSTGSAIPNIKGVKELKIIPVPLLSLQEQNQIVQEIESRLSVCDKLEETIKESLEKSEALRQSILKKAFEGKLLSDQELETCQKEPDWEPAEQLLKRIKSEKEKLSNNKRDTK